jgi:hypothetical protein
MKQLAIRALTKFPNCIVTYVALAAGAWLILTKWF